MSTPKYWHSVQLLLILAMGLFLAVPASGVHAESVSVVPPKFELFGNPGDILTEKIKVSNQSTAPATYQTDAEDFTASGDEGGVAFTEDATAPTTNFSLAKWITVEPSRLTVEANGEKSINVSIKIPKNAEPGGHFAAVQVALDTGAPVAGTAAVSSKLNTLILLRVSGALTEKLEVSSFTTADSYNTKGPIEFSLRSKNDGNVHVAPVGTIVITDMFNKKAAEIPLTQANILPGASRVVKTSWDSGRKIGKFTATVVATYGEGKEPLTSSTTFYIIPTPLIAGTLIGLLIIILLITQRRRFKKLLHNLTSD